MLQVSKITGQVEIPESTIKDVEKKVGSVSDFKDGVVEWENKKGWTFHVWAKDIKHAIEIAENLRKKLLQKGDKNA